MTGYPDQLQDPQQLGNVYAALCATQQHTLDRPTMDPAVCQATHLMGLQQGPCPPGTISTTQNPIGIQNPPATAQECPRELADWLHSTSIGRALARSCLPDDIMVYLNHTLPNHAGTTTKNRAHPVSPRQPSSSEIVPVH